MLLRILTFFKWVYGNLLTFLVGIRRIPAYHVDYTTENSISALYSYRAPVQPALGQLCARCSTNQCFVLFAGSEQSMCKDADIIYSSQTKLAGCDE